MLLHFVGLTLEDLRHCQLYALRRSGKLSSKLQQKPTAAQQHLQHEPLHQEAFNELCLLVPRWEAQSFTSQLMEHLKALCWRMGREVRTS
mmetsp:Transcript_47856/g.97413  ORF Transcript_47856/g.97413 Transcript_47856/m.97413 type:complete len:90 (+) Transcript_47856:919-1188(+)